MTRLIASVCRRQACMLCIGLLMLPGGCGHRASEPGQVEPVKGCDAAPAEKDNSLTAQQYINAGMPALDQPWGTDELTEAAQVLTAIAAKNPAGLPRYQSQRSGKVFARITSSETFAAFTDQNLPIDQRFAQVAAWSRASEEIRRLYQKASGSEQACSREVIELVGADFRAMPLILDVAQAFGDTFDPADPATPKRLQGLDQMKRALAVLAAVYLTALGQPDAMQPDDRAALMAYMQETFPEILPRLLPELRLDLLGRLKEMNEDPDLADLQSGLRELLVASEKSAEHAPAEPNAEPAQPVVKPAPPDGSLIVKDYIKLGLPDPVRVWLGPEMESAQSVLAQLAEKQPEYLPRYESKKSGAVFERLISSESPKRFVDPEADVENRLAKVAHYTSALEQINRLYLGAMKQHKVDGRDVLELTAASFRSMVAMTDVFRLWLKQTKAGDADRPQVVVAYGQICDALGVRAALGVGLLADRRSYRTQDLIQFAGYLEEIIPAVVPQVLPNVRAQIVTAIEAIEANPASKDLRPSLKDLHAKVQAAVEAADKADAAPAAEPDSDADPGGRS